MEDNKISGTDNLIKNLWSLNETAEKRLGKLAVRRAAQQYRRDVKKQIPLGGEKLRKHRVGERKGEYDDVHLSKSIAVRAAKGFSARKTTRYLVGIVGLARAYAHVYEFGGKYHTGTRVFTTTLETRSPQYFDIMRNEIKEGMKREALKLPKIRRKRIAKGVKV